MKSLQTSVRASDTIAIGRAFVVTRQSTTVVANCGSEAEEIERFTTALDSSIAQIEVLAESNDIFAALKSYFLRILIISSV